MSLPLHLQVAKIAQEMLDRGDDAGLLACEALQCLALEIRSLTTPEEAGGSPLTAETFYERQAARHDAMDGETCPFGTSVSPWPDRFVGVLDGRFVTPTVGAALPSDTDLDLVAF